MRFLKRVVSAIVTAAIMLSFAISGDAFGNAFYNAFCIVAHAAETGSWHRGMGTGTASVISNGNWLIIENADYGCTMYEQVFKVEPNSHYRFSATAAMGDFKAAPENSGKGGACIGEALSYKTSKHAQEFTQQPIAYDFDSGDRTEIRLFLGCGSFGEKCKGTAWFKDIKLEKMENKWDLGVIICSSVKASVTVNDKKTTFSDKFTSSDIKYLTSMSNRLKDSFNTLSEGRMNVNSVDVVTVKDAVTKLLYSDIYGYELTSEDPAIKKALDTMTAKKKYQIIAIIAPIGELVRKPMHKSEGEKFAWFGLSGAGADYKDIDLCQVRDSQGLWRFMVGKDSSLPNEVLVHEMTHRIEYRSQTIDPANTAKLDGRESIYNYASKDDCDWYRDYLGCRVNGSLGIHPDTYYASVAKTRNIKLTCSDEKEAVQKYGGFKLDRNGWTLEYSSTEPLTVKQFKDKLKAAGIPAEKICDSKYKSYSDKRVVNTDMKVVFEGQNVYFGLRYTAPSTKITTAPDKMKNFKASNIKSSSVKLSWTKDTNADGYQIQVYKDGKWSNVKVYDGSSTSSLTVKSLKSGTNYKFRIRAFKKDGKYKIYGNYSTIKAKTK